MTNSSTPALSRDAVDALSRFGKQPPRVTIDARILQPTERFDRPITPVIKTRRRFDSEWQNANHSCFEHTVKESAWSGDRCLHFSYTHDGLSLQFTVAQATIVPDGVQYKIGDISGSFDGVSWSLPLESDVVCVVNSLGIPQEVLELVKQYRA